MKKRILPFTVCLLVSAMLFFAGCGKDGEKGSGAAGKDKGEITLMIINSFTKTPEDPIYKAAEEYYGKTGVKINIEAVPSTNIKDKFTTAALAGSGPDIVTLDNAGWTADLAAIGLLAPIDDKVGQIKNDLLADALATNVYKGVTYGVPWYVNNMVMYYNKALFAKAGIAAPPKNWQELETAVQKLKATGKFGLNFPVGSPGGYTVCAFLLQNGNKIIDTSGSEAKVVFNDKSGVEALTYLTGLYTKYKGMPESVKSTLSWDQVFAPFIQEDVGIVFSGDWAIAPFKNGNPNLDYGIAPMPVGKEAASILGGYNLAINKNSKKQDLAWDFIKWMSQPEQIELLAKYSRISARKDNVNSSFVKENPVYQVFVQETVNSKSRPVVTQWQQVQTYLGEAFASVILGENTPQQALDKYAKLCDELIKNQ